MSAQKLCSRQDSNPESDDPRDFCFRCSSQGKHLQALADQAQQITASVSAAQKHLDALLLAVAHWEVNNSRNGQNHQPLNSSGNQGSMSRASISRKAQHAKVATMHNASQSGQVQFLTRLSSVAITMRTALPRGSGLEPR